MKKFSKRLIAILMVCLIVMPMSMIGVSAKEAEAPVVTPVLSRSPEGDHFVEALCRYAFFDILYLANSIYKPVQTSNLKKFSYVDSDDVLYLSAYFEDGNFISRMSYHVDIICGNKIFWNEVAARGVINVNTIAGFAQFIYSILLSLNPSFSQEADANRLKAYDGLNAALDGISLRNQISALPNDGWLAIILPCSVQQTMFGIIKKERILLPRADFVSFRDTIPDCPESEWPDWVTNF